MAATLRVGTVITGDPGTDAQVINSGNENDAIFDFVIPRGEPGGGGTPDVLATVDSTDQSTSAGVALTFNETPLISGNAITHQAGSPDIQIHQPGIYQASFHGTASPEPNTTIPSTLLAQLYLNGAPVAGATANHTFTASTEAATMTFSVPFRVDGAATLQVGASQAGFLFDDIALTVIRLGDAS